MARSESPLPLETSEVLSPSHHCFGPSRVEVWTVHVPWSWICWPSVQIVMSTTTAVHLGVEKFDRTWEAWHQMDFSSCLSRALPGVEWGVLRMLCSHDILTSFYVFAMTPQRSCGRCLMDWCGGTAGVERHRKARTQTHGWFFVDTCALHN